MKHYTLKDQGVYALPSTAKSNWKDIYCIYFQNSMMQYLTTKEKVQPLQLNLHPKGSKWTSTY